MYKYYSTNRSQLTIRLESAVPQNHLVRLIDSFVDTIPLDNLLKNLANTGRPAYHPALLLKILLFAYSGRTFSGRKIELMLQESLPMMWLARNERISYHTINNFRSSDKANMLVKRAFLYFTQMLIDENLIRENALFIDGTKLEADANKYSFVWRKAVEKYHDKLKNHALELYDELIKENVTQSIEREQAQEAAGLEEIAKSTEAKIEKLTEEIDSENLDKTEKSARKQLRRKLKKIARKLRKDYIPRAYKYEQSEKIFQGRNSYSKTDHDATFMLMKEDHMRNGQLKPGYNIQAATSNQYVIDYAIFPNPTDTRTLVPFLSQMALLSHFENIVADAGYGSEYNYITLEDQFKKKYYIQYSTYRIEKTRKYKKDPTKVANWHYDEADDFYIDPKGVRFRFKGYSSKVDRYGYKRDFKIYEADPIQETDELEEASKTPKGYQRRITYNPTWENVKAHAKEYLESEDGKRIYSYRKIDVEPIFGHLKNVFGMRRVHLRGRKKVETDVGLAFMMMNLVKYWSRELLKLSICHALIIFPTSKKGEARNITSSFTFFIYLKSSFFPDSFLCFVFCVFFVLNPGEGRR